MGDELGALIGLPFAAQLALGGGYVGYLVACGHMRARHSAIDVALLSLAFGLVAVGVDRALAGVAPRLGASAWVMGYLGPAIAVVATVAAAALWKRAGVFWWRRLARALRVSFDDGETTLWSTLVAETRFDFTQVTVRTRSGRVLHSQELHDFADQPFGPCIFGADGAIGLYVTEVTTADGTAHPVAPVEANGARLTIVPADEVAELDIRLMVRGRP